jgi:drug/metabolite transporter (DMT)-like permease
MTPLWAIVSRHSKNIIFDAALYDVIMFVFFLLGMVFLTKESLNKLQWIGLFLLFTGLFLIKSKDLLSIFKK